MCGIVGIYGSASKNILEKMTSAVKHRGPDDWGYYISPNDKVGLGHRRLAIIDLSSAGHQPMSYGNGKFWIVFNGEIYNYVSIRKDLEKIGHIFSTLSDTEVVLAAYDEWGVNCVNLLRGMFAFCIYSPTPDENHPALFLARDRFGIKPLLYTRLAGCLLFSSELDALLQSGIVPRIADHQAIWDYLSLGSVPQPRTIIKNVFSLMPGHALTINSAGELRIWQYWDILEEAGKVSDEIQNYSYVDICSKLLFLLKEATQLHLIADVPLGAFLSGGVDSTAVVGLMSRLTSKPIQTFTIGFEDQYKNLNELSWARYASKLFHTDHHEIILTGDEVAKEYDALVRAIDQPSFDGTNTYFVSKFTRQSVTVSLSGLGGDELFGGYLHFRRLQTEENFRRRLPESIQPYLRNISSGIGGKPNRVLQRLLRTRLDRYSEVRNFATDEQKKIMTNPYWSTSEALQTIQEFYSSLVKEELDSIQATSYVEINGYMANTLLRDADVMGMAHSLEIRPVLLDHKLAEFAFAIPSKYKVSRTRMKAVFIDALKGLMPPEILNRKKMGFGMPLYEWLSGPLKTRAKDVLNSQVASEVFSRNYLQSAIANLDRKNHVEVRLWAYVMLLEWLSLKQVSIMGE